MGYDLIPSVDDLRLAKQEFMLSPQQWRTLDIPSLDWEFVRFSKENKETIPQKKGIYCFIIRHDHAALPMHGYIAYVGLTGKSEQRNLRVRYSEYLRDQVRPKRIHIHQMLNRWSDDLYFYFSVVENNDIGLTTIETALLDALIPPFNEKDFSAELGQNIKAAWK